MDSNLIYERLKALGGGLKQEQYRDISQAFEEVIRYNQKALEDLKQQLQEELRDVSERYYLYGTVIQAEDVPIVNDFLFPMCGEPKGNNIITVYCECSLEELEAIFREIQHILIETGEGCYEAYAQFKPCKRYQREVEKLKQHYYENGRCWRTPFLPYIKRFADIECIQFLGGEQLLAEEQFPVETGKITAIRLKDNETVFRTNVLPVWNVEKIKRKCTVFPIPAIDEQYFKHSLDLPYPQDGYLVHMEPSVHNVFYQKDALVLVTEDKKQRDFELIRIAVKRELNVPHYKIMTNARNMRHIDRQAENAAVQLRSMAEIGRMVSSYEACADFQLCEAAVDGKILNLKFRVQKEDYMTDDRLAFLLNEVQSYYPQFQAAGEIVE